MKFKWFYTIPVILILNGCYDYNRVANPKAQDGFVDKSDTFKLLVKTTKTKPIFNEVTGAFGVTLGDVFSSTSSKNGVKFTPDSHPSYLSDFRYFTNDKGIVYKITALGQFLEYSRFSQYEYQLKCNEKQNNLVNILKATYENKASKEKSYVFFNSSRYTYYNHDAIHKNKIIVTACKARNKRLVVDNEIINKFRQDAKSIFGAHTATYKDSYKYDTSFVVTYLNPKLSEEYKLKERLKKEGLDAQDIKKKKKLRQLLAEEYGLVKSSNDIFNKSKSTNIKPFKDVLKRSIGNKSVSIPIPNDWFEVSSEIPKLFKTFEKITLPPNRVVAAFLPNADKKTPKLNRYTLVLTSKDAEKMPDLPSSEFAWFKSQVRNKQDTLVKWFKEKYGDSWSIPDAPSLSKFKIGEMIPIGIFIDKNNAFAQATIMNTETTSATESSSYRNVVVGAATILVKGKLLNIQVNSTYKTNEDVLWVKATTKELVDLILQAN